ncbi:hypothetical protein ACFQ9X_45830 [Catenulispora yoronensis]
MGLLLLPLSPRRGVRFARGALAHADRAGLTAPSVTRARVVLGLGALLELQGKGFEAMHALREAVRLAQLCDDPTTEAYALRILAVNTLMIGDPEGDTAELADRAQHTARRSGSLWQQAFASHMPVLLHDGEPDPERVAHSWRLTSGTGDRRLLAYLRVMMSFSELGGERAQETISTLNAAYQDFQDVGDRYGRLLALSTRLLAHLRWDEDARVAAMLIGKCEAAYAGIGSGPLAVFAEQIAQAAAQVRSRLGDDAYGARCGPAASSPGTRWRGRCRTRCGWATSAGSRTARSGPTARTAPTTPPTPRPRGPGRPRRPGPGRARRTGS